MTQNMRCWKRQLYFQIWKPEAHACCQPGLLSPALHHLISDFTETKPTWDAFQSHFLITNQRLTGLVLLTPICPLLLFSPQHCYFSVSADWNSIKHICTSAWTPAEMSCGGTWTSIQFSCSLGEWETQTRSLWTKGLSSFRGIYWNGAQFILHFQ